MIDVNISIFAIEMERPLEDQEANIAYWYYSQWKDIGSKAKSFDKKTKGDKSFSIGK